MSPAGPTRRTRTTAPDGPVRHGRAASRAEHDAGHLHLPAVVAGTTFLKLAALVIDKPPLDMCVPSGAVLEDGL